MSTHDLARRQGQTARAFIDARHALQADTDAWIEGMMALRSPDCIFAVRPKFKNLPDMDNDQFRRWLHELNSAQHIWYTKWTIKGVRSGDDRSIVIVTVVYEGGTWPSNQQHELEHVLTLTDDGEKIKRDEIRLVDPEACEQWREASDSYLERVQLQATQDWLKEQNARWL